MSKMVIKKRISFDFLGEEYKEAYAVFSSIPISEWPEVSGSIDKEEDGLKKMALMLKLLREKFVEGKFPDDKGELAEIKADEFEPDVEVLMFIYDKLMGAGDPKVLRPSENT